MLLICQKSGEVVALLDADSRNPDKDNLVTVLNIEDKVCHDGEQGIAQVLPHPDFGDENRYVYLFYTYDKHGGCLFDDQEGAVNVVSRWTLNEDLKMVNERILLETSPLPSKVHNAGDMVFGHDGYLYVT